MFAWILFVVFLYIILLVVTRSDPMRIEQFANPQHSITKKDKAPTCGETAIAYKTVIRYILEDISGDGSVLLNHFRDTFLQIDNDCMRTGTCSPIGLRRDFDLDTIYNVWSNPLKC